MVVTMTMYSTYEHRNAITKRFVMKLTIKELLN